MKTAFLTFALMFREIVTLLKKDVLLEWRMRYAIGGILLYVVATVFVINIILSSEKADDLMNARWWSVLFWITMLFTAVNAIAKSFTQESRERLLYYYTLVRPLSVIVAKMCYNMLLMLLLSLIGLAVFSLMLGASVKNYPLFLLALFLGGSGLSFMLTLVSSIAAKADNNSTLMAILSLPVMLPFLIILQQFAANAFVINIPLADIAKAAVPLVGFDVLLVTLSSVLFPYLWRD